MSGGWLWGLMRKPYKTPECSNRQEKVLIIPAVTGKMMLASYAGKTLAIPSYPEII